MTSSIFIHRHQLQSVYVTSFEVLHFFCGRSPPSVYVKMVPDTVPKRCLPSGFTSDNFSDRHIFRDKNFPLVYEPYFMPEDSSKSNTEITKRQNEEQEDTSEGLCSNILTHEIYIKWLQWQHFWDLWPFLFPSIKWLIILSFILYLIYSVGLSFMRCTPFGEQIQRHRTLDFPLTETEACSNLFVPLPRDLRGKRSIHFQSFRALSLGQCFSIPVKFSG